MKDLQTEIIKEFIKQLNEEDGVNPISSEHDGPLCLSIDVSSELMHIHVRTIQPEYKEFLEKMKDEDNNVDWIMEFEDKVFDCYQKEENKARQQIIKILKSALKSR